MPTTYVRTEHAAEDAPAVLRDAYGAIEAVANADADAPPGEVCDEVEMPRIGYAEDGSIWFVGATRAFRYARAGG